MRPQGAGAGAVRRRDSSEGRASRRVVVVVFRKGGWYRWKPWSSSIRAFRAYPLIEIKQTAPCRAFRGKSSDSRQQYLSQQYPPPLLVLGKKLSFPHCFWQVEHAIYLWAYLYPYHYCMDGSRYTRTPYIYIYIYIYVYIHTHISIHLVCSNPAGRGPRARRAGGHARARGADDLPFKKVMYILLCVYIYIYIRIYIYIYIYYSHNIWYEVPELEERGWGGAVGSRKTQDAESDPIWYGMTRYDMIRCDMLWFATILASSRPPGCIYIYTHTYTCLDNYMYTHIYIHMHYVSLSLSLYIYICMYHIGCICMIMHCAYIYIYLSLYIYIYILAPPGVGLLPRGERGLGPVREPGGHQLISYWKIIIIINDNNNNDIVIVIIIFVRHTSIIGVY